MYPLTRDNFKSILNIFTIAIWWWLFVQIQHRALWDSKLPGSRVSTAQGVLRKLEFLSLVSGPVCVCVCWGWSQDGDVYSPVNSSFSRGTHGSHYSPTTASLPSRAWSRQRGKSVWLQRHWNVNSMLLPWWTTFKLFKLFKLNAVFLM